MNIKNIIMSVVVGVTFYTTTLLIASVVTPIPDIRSFSSTEINDVIPLSYMTVQNSNTITEKNAPVLEGESIKEIVTTNNINYMYQVQNMVGSSFSIKFLGNVYKFKIVPPQPINN